MAYIRITVLIAGMLWLPEALWAEENRLALVIGNSSYQESPLVNPRNDAADMAEVLEELGFTVMLRTDADRREMARSIRDFGRELKEKRGVGLFYYAGHGIQINNSNYLIPVDTPVEEEDEVPFESIDVGSVLAKMESAGNSLNLLILDACRNNPFPRQFRSSSRGLARVEAPVGSLVVYSTAPGDVAADGEGRNGVFTGALLEQLRTQGLSLTQTIRRTRAAVVKATGGRQVPWESSSLMQDYYFNQAAPEPEPQPEIAAKPPAIARLDNDADAQAGDSQAASTTTLNEQNYAALQLDSDVVFWNSVQAGNTLAEYRAYLERFPDGLFASLASSRLERLAAETSDTGTNNKQDANSTTNTQTETLPTAPADAATVAVNSAESTTLDTASDAAAEATAQPVDTEQSPKPESAAESSDEPLQVARLEDKPQPAPKPSKKPGDAELGTLTLDVVPPEARVRIMNIVEKYKPGISLDRSRSYDVYVTHPGYESFRQNISLDEPDQTLAIVLRERNAAAPLTVPLSGGSFTMGCSDGDALCEPYEKPAHSVAVAPFAMMRNEVTVAEFGAFVDATGYVTDAEKNAGGNRGCYIWAEGGGISRSTARWEWKPGTSWRDPGYAQKSDYPVTCVSWNDATAYATWLSQKTGRQYSLPTEAEWEFAARAGSTQAFGTSTDARAVCQQGNIADKTLSPSGSKWSERIACTDRFWFSAPVASFKPNALGLHDMQGNVWEWVQDTWAASFKSTPRDGQANTTGEGNDRVLRGGAWDGDEKRVRLSSRSKGTRISRAAMTGFRLVVR